LACTEKEPVGPSEPRSVVVEFKQNNFSVREGGNRNITIKFSQPLSVSGSVEIAVNELSGTAGTDYSSSPAIDVNRIRVTAASGVGEIDFSITALVDSDMDLEEIELEIANVEGDGLEIGSSKSATISIVEASYIDPQFQDCLIDFNDDEFEIATWNIQNFPLNGNTIHSLIELIPNLQVDLIGVQEIQNIAEFMDMADQLVGWSGVVEDINGTIELGFLYRESAISNFGSTSKLFVGDTYAYTREAVAVDVTHVNGMNVKVINIHLKCCNDGVERRMDASRKLKELIDSNFNNDNLIVLGDFNEVLGNSSAFNNFSSDPNNYFFADQSISDGATSNWSFPSFPSHIDHILCTNELANNFVSVHTFTLDDCIANYESVVSDHLPVVAVFK